MGELRKETLKRLEACLLQVVRLQVAEGELRKERLKRLEVCLLKVARFGFVPSGAEFRPPSAALGSFDESDEGFVLEWG